MKFKDLVSLANEYAEWIKQHNQVEDCTLSVMCFLDSKGYLKMKFCKNCDFYANTATPGYGVCKLDDYFEIVKDDHEACKNWKETLEILE